MPRFKKTSCSQCGTEFGPGDHGFSHCDQHRSVIDRAEIWLASLNEKIPFDDQSFLPSGAVKLIIDLKNEVERLNHDNWRLKEYGNNA